MLRPAAPPTTNISTIQRPTNVAAMPQVTQPSPILVPPSKIKPTAQEVSEIPTAGGSEEDMCVICHEDMNLTSIVVTLECGHRYHSHVRFVERSLKRLMGHIPKLREKNHHMFLWVKFPFFPQLSISTSRVSKK